MKLVVGQFCRVVVVVGTLPFFGMSVSGSPVYTAIQANSKCELGDCQSPGVIGNGAGYPGVSAGAFDFSYTFADGDEYLITGTYDNSYPPQSLMFNPTVSYLGNTLHKAQVSAGTDVLDLTMFQTIEDPSGRVWNGKYCEATGATSASKGVTSLLTESFDAKSLDVLTFSSKHPKRHSCAELTFSKAENASDFIDDNILIETTFDKGLAAGASFVDAAAVPEPTETISAGVALMWFALVALRRRHAAKLR